MTADFILAVLDTLLPGDATLPPASRSGVDAAAYPSAHQAAFTAIADAAGGEAAFIARSPDAQADVLRAIDRGAAATAFKALVAAALQDYYTRDAVVAALGWRQGPPQPSGHKLTATDEETWQRLERVKRRSPLWRRTS